MAKKDFHQINKEKREKGLPDPRYKLFKQGRPYDEVMQVPTDGGQKRTPAAIDRERPYQGRGGQVRKLFDRIAAPFSWSAKVRRDLERERERKERDAELGVQRDAQGAPIYPGNPEFGKANRSHLPHAQREKALVSDLAAEGDFERARKLQKIFEKAEKWRQEQGGQAPAQSGRAATRPAKGDGGVISMDAVRRRRDRKKQEREQAERRKEQKAQQRELTDDLIKAPAAPAKPMPRARRRPSDPKLTASDAAKMLREGADARVRAELADREEFHSDPEFRRAYTESIARVGISAASGRLRILRGATPEQFREEFEVQCRMDPENAIAMIEHFPEQAQAVLGKDDLIPLLEADSTRIRTRAITLLTSLPRAMGQKFEREAPAPLPPIEDDFADLMGEPEPKQKKRRTR